MKRLTIPQENLQLSRIIGPETVNKLLKQEIRESVSDTVNNREKMNSKDNRIVRVK